MMQTIVVEGDLYEMNMVQITENQFKVLTAGVGRDADFWEELEEELMSDALISGFTYSEEGPNFRVYVNGQEYPDINDISVSTYVEGQENVLGSQAKQMEKTYHLIVEKFSKRAQIHLEIEGEFYSEKLGVAVDTQELPDGSIQSVLSPYYMDLDFEFDESWTGCEEIYILTSESERYVL